MASSCPGNRQSLIISLIISCSLPAFKDPDESVRCAATRILKYRLKAAGETRRYARPRQFAPFECAGLHSARYPKAFSCSIRSGESFVFETAGARQPPYGIPSFRFVIALETAPINPESSPIKAALNELKIYRDENLSISAINNAANSSRRISTVRSVPRGTERSATSSVLAHAFHVSARMLLHPGRIAPVRRAIP